MHQPIEEWKTLAGERAESLSPFRSKRFKSWISNVLSWSGFICSWYVARLIIVYVSIGLSHECEAQNVLRTK